MSSAAGYEVDTETSTVSPVELLTTFSDQGMSAIASALPRDSVGASVARLGPWLRSGCFDACAPRVSMAAARTSGIRNTGSDRSTRANGILRGSPWGSDQFRGIPERTLLLRPNPEHTALVVVHPHRAEADCEPHRISPHVKSGHGARSFRVDPVDVARLQ